MIRAEVFYEWLIAVNVKTRSISANICKTGCLIRGP
jgi:hypothetical protein